MPTGSNPGAFEVASKGESVNSPNRRLVFTKSTSFWVSDLGWSPNTDIFETEFALIIRVEIAGIEKNSINITLKSNTLSICGHRNDPRRSQNVNFHQAEISYGPFEKVIILPEYLQNKKINATYREGFLEICINKNPDTSNSITEVEIED